MTLLDQLKRDEGIRYTMYQDSRGVPTIGVGHNLYVPISQESVNQILQDDLERIEVQINTFPWAAGLSDARLGVVKNMVFNLGLAGFLKFVQMIDALKAGDWNRAADEMLESTWATQVGIRAQRLAIQMREYRWQ